MSTTFVTLRSLDLKLCAWYCWHIKRALVVWEGSNEWYRGRAQRSRVASKEDGSLRDATAAPLAAEGGAIGEDRRDVHGRRGNAQGICARRRGRGISLAMGR